VPVVVWCAVRGAHKMLRACSSLLRRGAAALQPSPAPSRSVYTMIEHQARAMKQAGKVANKFKYRGRPRVDKKFAEPQRAWILVDAYGEVMGRLASKIVPLLTGKHKPIWQPHRDCGDNVVIVNTAYVVVTGKGMERKKYYHHTGYAGGLKTMPIWRLFEKNPVEPLRRAIFGMMPKNRLRYQRMSRLRMYPAGMHKQEPNLLARDGIAFRARFPPNDGPAVLERIWPAGEEPDSP
jgi:large subunit ribosomal protein L13